MDDMYAGEPPYDDDVDKLLINNNSWIFVNFSLNESKIRSISEKLTRRV